MKMKMKIEKFLNSLKKFTAIVVLAQMALTPFTVNVAYAATTVVAGWTFPEGSNDKYADSGSAANIGISEISEVGASNLSFNENGIDSGSDKAAKAKRWDKGDYWLVKMSTEDYENLTLSSKQRNDSKGPRDFEIDYSINNGSSWSTVTGSGYQITNASWNNAGALNDLPLPSNCDDRNSLWIRWRVDSDHAATGHGDIDRDHYNSIDNIFIEGEYHPSNIPVTANAGTGGTASADPDSVEYGGSSTLTAVPNTGYHFIGWSGDCSGDTNPYYLTNIQSSKECTANFAINEYDVIANANSGGTASAEPDSVEYGGSSTLTAVPNTGYHFTGWSGDCSGTNNPYNLTNIQENKECTASFGINKYSVTLYVSGGGTVSGDGVYDYGEDVDVSATPGLGWHFFNWSGEDQACDSWNQSDIINNIDRDYECTANFVQDTYVVSFVSNGGSSVSPETGLLYGSMVTEPVDPTKSGCS